MASSAAARVFAIVLLAGLALVPALAAWVDQPFWVTLFSRILIFALAATSPVIFPRATSSAWEGPETYTRLPR